MTRSLTAEETAALPPMPLGLPVDLPITLREVVWASAYAADFARQFAEIRSAVDPGPTRDELATFMVNVARCKAVADAAVDGMGGPARYNDCSAEEREALLATDEAVRADLSKRTPAELDTLSALCEAKR